jgi:hypothetical protein
MNALTQEQAHRREDAIHQQSDKTIQDIVQKGDAKVYQTRGEIIKLKLCLEKKEEELVGYCFTVV